MNHFDARQDAMTRKWHYTCRSGLEIWAVGRCDNDGGHETEEAARNCYRSYLIENAKSIKLGKPADCVHPDCDKPAERAAEAGGNQYPLCKDHLGPKGLDAAFPAVGTTILQ